MKSPPRSGSAIAFTVKSRWRRSASIVVSGERQQVDLPSAIAGGHPPRAEALRQLERVRVRRAREPAGERLGVARDGDVEVLGRPAKQPVAHGATDEPAVVVSCESSSSGAIHDGSPSRW